ncbi:MAG: protein translocase subunit SecD [Planctomycetes bacterium]|nr:protein translocase subunit SecD [Planctomycetota bacterium]
MLRRLIVTATVCVVALLLLAVQNKVLVGQQDLQADLNPVEGQARTFAVVLRDVAGNPVDAVDGDRVEAELRIKGNDRLKALPMDKLVHDGRRLLVTLPEAAAGPGDEAALRSRLCGRPYHRDNPARSLLHITRGIDLRGGVEFICRLHDDEGRTVAADEETVHILRGRLDERGLTEPAVSRLSNGDIQIVIPGGTRADAARTRRVLETSGRLEFREVMADFTNVRLGEPDQPVVAKANGGYDAGPGTYLNRRLGELIAPQEAEPGEQPHTFYRLGAVRLQGKDVAQAGETIHQGELAVSIEFTATGAAKNEAFTREVKARGDRGDGTGRLAIIFDGVVKSAPRVIEPSGQNCVISGRFTKDEIDNLKAALKGGSLVVTPEVISERVVGATLGEQTVTMALLAMALSSAAIVLFMWCYYGLVLGTVANLSLCVGAFLVWAVLSMFSATVTLPGLAGLVLTIGMAVDTNILIFERIREELKENKGMKAAIEAGYDRAFLTILDSNLTTFLTAFILYWIGSGPVKGFGLTLMIGLTISMFSGVYVSRMINDWLCRRREGVWMSEVLVRPSWRFPYVAWRHVGYALSILTGLFGIGWFLFGHHLSKGRTFDSNFDIDFTGGNMVLVNFREPKEFEAIEAAVQKAWAALPADQRPGSMVDPAELRKQAYFAELGKGGASRQWAFRARDEEGGRLEAERAEIELQRGKVQRELDTLRSEDKPDPAKVKALEARVAEFRQPIEDLGRRIAERTEVFKRQVAGVFSGDIATEGEEVLKASWQGRSLALDLATLEEPTATQVAEVAERLKRRPELEAIQVAAAGKSLTISATLRTAPAAAKDLEVSDPVLVRLRTLGGGATPEQANGQAAAAFDLYNGVVNVAANQKLTIARPFPASEHFSGQVAGQMKVRALAAIILSLMGILAYVAARFEFRFGVGAVVALFHDILLTVGLASLLGIRIDLTVIAALLTIIGFSINDTIVTFDRIRENLKKMVDRSLADIIDISVAQTMPRTLLTTGTVVMTTVVLLLWGGESLYAFTATLLIGLIAGTYSSIFVASPLLLTFKGQVVEALPVDETAETKPAIEPPPPSVN